MIKILNVIIFVIVVTLFNYNSNAIAEEKPDCSQYSTKTFAGLQNKINCKKGKPVRFNEKTKGLADLNPFKPKDEFGKVIEKKKLSCGEHSTKTIVGLYDILKCKGWAKNK